MDPTTILSIANGLACLLSLIAVVLALRPLQIKSNRGGWILLAAAFLLLAVMAGLNIGFLLATHTPDLNHDPVAAGILIATGLLACISASILSKRSLGDFLQKKAAQESAERFLLAFEKVPQIQVIKDRQGIYEYTNPVYNQFLGKKGQSLLGESDQKFFPRAQANSIRQEEEKVIESVLPRSRDEEIRGVDGVRWFRMTRTPLLDEHNVVKWVLVTGVDITASKSNEIVLADLKQSLVILYETERAMSDTVDQAAMWENILAWAGKLANTVHNGLWQVIPERSTAILKAGNGKLSGQVGMQMRSGEDIVWKVWQNGQSTFVNDYQAWPSRSQWLKDDDFSAVIGLPIKTKAQVAFVLTLYCDKAGQVFRDEQVQILSAFAQLASARLQNADRFTNYQSELEEWKRKLDNLHYRVRLEHIVAVIAAHFIGLDLEKIDDGITRSLQTIAKFLGIDRCYLVLFSKNGKGPYDSSVFYSSAMNPGDERREDFASEDFRWYLSKLNQSEAIHISKVHDLLPDNDEAALYLQNRGIKSFTAIPLVSNRSVMGYLGFETLQIEIEWSPEILALLKVDAEMVVNLLDRKRTAMSMAEKQEKITHQIASLEQHSQESKLLTEMGDLLQACRTADEAYPIIIRFVQRLIPAGSGAIYLIYNTKDPAEKVAAWGSDQPGPNEHELILNECWALRRGRTYVVQDPESESICNHIKAPIKAGYMCVPLIAQGEAAGILHLRLSTNGAGGLSISESQQALAAKIGEFIAITLTNLKLRDNLRSQAIRDPLTGLFNRRYMEETLDREIRRAVRHSTSVGLIMFDIDKMKPINDRFGHDAGDLLLKTLGKELLGLFRGEDVACRYGGDEFTIVLPEATLSDVWRRAEQMRETIKKLDLKYTGKSVGQITLSIGVAAFPDHGQTAERVLLACDAASYASKSEGGDRIMMGHKVEA
jgi:diguanylate cyclase (GGDEF)-like protein/PAS domain S-box-containing protein